MNLLFPKVLILSIIVYFTSCFVPESKFKIDYDYVRSSARGAMRFLKDCKSLRKDWPQAYINLTYIKTLRFGFNLSDSDLCGQHKARIITLYRPALREKPGCMGSLHLVIAHELMHRIGLPDHIPGIQAENVLKYLKTDPIERAMRACREEQKI